LKEYKKKFSSSFALLKTTCITLDPASAHFICIACFLQHLIPFSDSATPKIPFPGPPALLPRRELISE
jgi:hypothetical protein